MNELMMNKIGTLTMTLKEITDLLKVRHDKSMKTVETMADTLGFGTMSKIDIVYNNQGQTIETYLLDKRQSLAVAARLNTTLLMRVIDRWQELEAQPIEKKPEMIDFARAYIAEHEKNAVLMLENQTIKTDNLALAQLMNLSNKEEDAKDNHWAACRILHLINSK